MLSKCSEHREIAFARRNGRSFGAQILERRQALQCYPCRLVISSFANVGAPGIFTAVGCAIEIYVSGS